jgi:hypothetical protein
MKYTHESHDDCDATPLDANLLSPEKGPQERTYSRSGNGSWRPERGAERKVGPNDGLSFRPGPDKRPPYEGPGNLAAWRNWTKPITSGDEADLFRTAQAGDSTARDRIVRAFHWLVIDIASGGKKKKKRKYKAFCGPSLEEKISAGLLGLAEAINHYDIKRNTKFSTYAKHWIEKHIGLECRAWRRRQLSGETRADRVLFSHTGASPEQLAELAHCSIESAEEAIQRHGVTFTPYGGSECGSSGQSHDDDVRSGRKLRTPVQVDLPPAEVHPDAVDTDDDWEAIEAYRKRPQGSHEYYDAIVSGRTRWKNEKRYEVWGAYERTRKPLKSISRERYVTDQTAVHTAAKAQVAIRVLASKVDQAVFLYAAYSETHARRRLQEIGRRAYALELVEHDRERIAARSEPSQYLKRTQMLADPSVEKPALKLGRKHKPRRPVIRSWRSETTAEVAA